MKIIFINILHFIAHELLFFVDFIIEIIEFMEFAENATTF